MDIRDNTSSQKDSFTQGITPPNTLKRSVGELKLLIPAQRRDGMPSNSSMDSSLSMVNKRRSIGSVEGSPSKIQMEGEEKTVKKKINRSIVEKAFEITQQYNLKRENMISNRYRIVVKRLIKPPSKDFVVKYSPYFDSLQICKEHLNIYRLFVGIGGNTLSSDCESILQSAIAEGFKPSFESALLVLPKMSISQKKQFKRMKQIIRNDYGYQLQQAEAKAKYLSSINKSSMNTLSPELFSSVVHSIILFDGKRKIQSAQAYEKKCVYYIKRKDALLIENAEFDAVMTKITTAVGDTKLVANFMQIEGEYLEIDDDVNTSEVGEISAKQYARLVKQLLICFRLLQEKMYRNKEEIELIVNMTGDIDVLQNKLYAIRTDFSMIVVANKVANEFDVSARTVLDYFNDFKKSGYKSFASDNRGKHYREDFLERHGFETAFKLEMSMTKTLSVAHMKDYVHKELIIKKLGDLQAKPLAHSTIWKLMLQHGAKHALRRQNFYTDRHDTVDNINDRVKRLIPDKWLFSRRECCWCLLIYDVTNPHCLIAIEDAMLRMGITNPSLLKFVDIDTVRMVKVHIDYYVDSKGNDKYIEHRAELLRTTGYPGLFLYETRMTVVLLPNGERKNSIEFVPGQFDIICKCKHATGETCLCDRPLLVTGQDEAIFGANSVSLREWMVDEKSELLPKTEGTGEMVALLLNEFSIGIKMTPKDIDAMNDILVLEGILPLMESPGCEHFCHGKNRDGYWNMELATKQLKAVKVALIVLYPGFQHVLELDHSGPHMHALKDGLSTSKMALNWGGKQPQMHPTIVQVVGDGIGRTLNVGDTQYSYFTADDDPPFDPKFGSPAPPHNRPFTPEEQLIHDNKKKIAAKAKETVFNKKIQKLAVEKSIPIAQAKTFLVANQKQEAEKKSRSKEKKILTEKLKVASLPPTQTTGIVAQGYNSLFPLHNIEAQEIEENEDGEYNGEEGDETQQQLNDRGWRKGYIGQQVGAVLYLKKRGLWKEGMKGKLTAAEKKKHEKEMTLPDISMRVLDVLADQPDFKEEKMAIEAMWEYGGHIMQPSVKCHPEIAGVGVEYVWGMSKRKYRKDNDRNPRNLRLNISLALDHVRLENLWAFARRTRDLMKAYLLLAANIESGKTNQDDVSHKLIEELREHIKVKHRGHHRCAEESERRIIIAEEMKNSAL